MSKSKDEKHNSKDKIEKRHKKEKKEKTASRAGKIKDDKAPVFSLLADEKATNPILSSLFAARVRVTHIMQQSMVY